MKNQIPVVDYRCNSAGLNSALHLNKFIYLRYNEPISLQF